MILGIDEIILFLDTKPNEEQNKALDMIKKTLGNIIDIKTVKVEIYDILKIAEESVKCIDSAKGEIYVNITPGRKTQALGVLFAVYNRIENVKGIIYVSEEDKKIIYLPKLSFDLNNSQRKILEYIKDYKVESLNDIKVDMSKGMLYRTIKDLINLGYIINFELTDAGRIAIL